jgi:osmotically-inducible protein OsmY
MKAMKKISSLKYLVWCALLITGVELTSCKSKKNTESSAPATTAPAPDTITTVAPVQISPDDSLQKGVRDATKDYPGVNASVSNGEVTLTGTINRDKLPKLMQSLHSLHPKRINSKDLTVK